MKKLSLTLLFLLITALTIVFITGCGGEKDAPDTETSVNGQSSTETTEDKTVRYKISDKGEYYIPLYDWYRKEESTIDRRGMEYWNNRVAVKLHCNWINVFPYGKNKAGTKSMSGAFLLDEDRIMAYCQSGLRDSHSLGIKIMTTAPISEVFPETWKDWGVDPDLVRAVNPDGSLSTTYSSGLSHACTFIQLFRDMLFSYTEKSAQNGFDGCLYDGNSYGCEPGFYCCCDACRASWKKFSAERLGREVELPTRAVDMENTDVGRAFIIWRLEEFSGLLVALRDAGRKYNPDFEVYLNCENFQIANAYYFLNGLDVITSEYGSVLDLGHESTLFMFAYNEAFTDKQLITFIQKYTDQFDNINEYYTTMAEAYAAGGAMCAAETIRSKPMEFYVNDTGIRFGEMISENVDSYRLSGNIAKTAIVYSWQNGSFHQMKKLPTFPEAKQTMPREEFPVNASRQTASVLARNAIPFAYVVPETKPKYEDIAQYSTIILSDMEILDKDFEELLTKFLEDGGNILVTGNVFADRCPVGEGIQLDTRMYDLLEKWTGTKYADSANYAVYKSGNGKVVVCKSVLRGESEKSSHVYDEFMNALNELHLRDLVKIEKAPEQGYVETAFRSNAYGTEMYLHLINIDVNDGYKPTKYTVSAEIPDGATVTGVKADSPFVADPAEIGVEWEVKDGRLWLSGNFNLYSMLTLSMKY